MVLHVDRNDNEVRTTYNVDGNPVLETGTDRNGENRVTRSFEYDASGNVRKAVAGGFCYTYEYRPDGLNLYAYCKNNPVVYYDPSGFSAWDDFRRAVKGMGMSSEEISKQYHEEYGYNPSKIIYKDGKGFKSRYLGYGAQRRS